MDQRSLSSKKAPGVTKATVLVTLSVFLSLGVFVWKAFWCRTAVFEEPRAALISLALFRLARSSSQVEPVWPEKNRWIQYAFDGKGATKPYVDNDAIARFLISKGWKFYDQYGSSRIFKRNRTERLGLDCSMYTLKYQVCTADDVP